MVMEELASQNKRILNAVRSTKHGDPSSASSRLFRYNRRTKLHVKAQHVKPSKQILSLAIISALSATMGLTAVTMSTATIAAAPMVKVSAPGYYRMMLGDFEVTAISDGTVVLPVHQLLKQAPEKTQEALGKVALKSPLETSVNAYLINTGEKLVLIDAGAGKLFGPTLGNVVNNIKAAGYQPEQIDEIYITHMHADHVGGLVVDGKMMFPNAIIRADKKDADLWLSEANMNAAPEANKGFFKGAMASLNPYVAAGKFKAFEGNTDLVKGVKAGSSYGHTPGHTTYTIESKGERLSVIGDLMHVAAVQFDDPSVTIAFDIDVVGAAKERTKAYAESAQNGTILAIAHVSFPGLGRVVPKGAAYGWVPVNYSVVKPAAAK